MNFLLETLQLFIPAKKKNWQIGRLMALEFASMEVALVLWTVSHEGMKETARKRRRRGPSGSITTCATASDRAEVYRVARVKREVGGCQHSHHNAGIVTGKKFMESPDSLIEKTVEVNTMSHFWTYKAFLPAMTSNNHGHLVSISSSAGLIGVNGLADYCASKFAAVGFAESVALELLSTGKNGVKTTIVCPYFINTGMFDGCGTKWPVLLPILEPNYVAKKIVDAILTDQAFLLLPRTLYILMALKNIIPVKQTVLLGMYLGAFNFMDSFKGRSKKRD
uniref:Short-chain dehydrogenase/reductase 3 n=1 Tax=Denticeps clupeoides TaxID=299321 RepID=A0AAY4APZ7_9TELE